MWRWNKHGGWNGALALALGLFWAVAGWAQETRTVVDMGGRSVTVPAHIQRVYAVGHCLPMVAAVAPEALLNSYPLTEEAKAFLSPSIYQGKAVPHSGMRFSDEEVLNLHAQVVILEATPNGVDSAERLQEKLKLPVLLVSQDMHRYREAFAFLGQVLERPAQAARLSAFVSRYLEPLEAQARTIPARERVRVYYAENPDGLATNPSGSSHSQMLDYVGADNVARVTNVPDEGFSQVSMEQLLVWQPEVILTWTVNAAAGLPTYRAVTRGPLWQQLTAVRRGRVYQIPWLPFSWFDRPPGTNRILGTLWLAQLLYPRRFHYDLVQVTREYFHTFYHRDLSVAQARYLLNSAKPPARP